MAWNFPIYRRVIAWAGPTAAAWRERHRHPANFGLHLVGIALVFLSLPLLLVLPWPWCLGLFAGGYLLQWAGHLVEGNDVGELIPLKRALGLRVVAVAPGPPPSPQP